MAVILLLAALMMEGPAHDAAAQSQPCTAVQNDAERLACYDRALRATSPAPAAPAPASPAAQAPAAQAPAAPVAQAPAPAAPPPAAQAQAPPAPTAPAATVAPASQTNRDRITSIVVVTVRTLPGRETTFTTADGATWAQTDSQRIYGLPEVPFDAELKPGAVGSTFLVPKTGGRAIRVKLVER